MDKKYDVSFTEFNKKSICVCKLLSYERNRTPRDMLFYENNQLPDGTGASTTPILVMLLNQHTPECSVHRLYSRALHFILERNSNVLVDVWMMTLSVAITLARTLSAQAALQIDRV